MHAHLPVIIVGFLAAVLWAAQALWRHAERHVWNDRSERWVLLSCGLGYVLAWVPVLLLPLDLAVQATHVHGVADECSAQRFSSWQPFWFTIYIGTLVMGYLLNDFARCYVDSGGFTMRRKASLSHTSLTRIVPRIPKASHLPHTRHASPPPSAPRCSPDVPQSFPCFSRHVFLFCPSFFPPGTPRLTSPPQLLWVVSRCSASHVSVDGLQVPFPLLLGSPSNLGTRPKAQTILKSLPTPRFATARFATARFATARFATCLSPLLPLDPPPTEPPPPLDPPSPPPPMYISPNVSL